MSGKVRKTLTLDPEVVAVLGEDPAGLSAAVNEILGKEVEQREMRAALRRFVEKLEEEFGPPDPEKVARAEELLR